MGRGPSADPRSKISISVPGSILAQAMKEAKGLKMNLSAYLTHILRYRFTVERQGERK